MNISSKEWKRVLGSSAYPEIITLLVENEIIEKNDIYSTSGKKNKQGKPFSKSYRLHPSWRDTDFEIRTIEYTQPKASRAANGFSEALEKDNAKLYSVRDKKSLKSILERFTLDKAKAMVILPIIAQNRKWSIRTKVGMLWMIEEFDQIKSFTIGKTGRFFCIGNRIATELRDAILLDGKPTDELDISCSNPTILFALYPECSLERERYRKLVESGKLYDAIKDDLRIMRDTAKKGTYKVMFGGKNKMISEWFAKRFPELSEIMKQYPKGELSRILQKKESSVIVKGLMLESDISCLSIHDGLRLNPSDTARAISLIKKLFQEQFGITPNITIKRASEDMDCAA